MKNFKTSLVFVLLGSLLFSCKKATTKTSKPVSFSVLKTTEKIIIDGKMNEAIWKKSAICSLPNFYNYKKASETQKTAFRMLWDDKNLYLFFQCEDQYINAKETKRDGLPFLDDCVEFFLIPAPEPLNMHFCFEVNANKAINDIVFLNNIYNGKDTAIKSFNPEIEIEVDINGTVNNNSDIDKGWSMEFSIPLKSFNRMNEFHPIAEGTNWSYLVVRQDRNKLDTEDRTTSTNFKIENFAEKDVHQPTMFGLLEFK